MIPRFLGTTVAAALVLSAIGVPILLLNAAPQRPAAASTPSPATPPKAEPAPDVPRSTIERLLGNPQDARIAFREAQDVVRGLQLKEGKLIIDELGPKRAPSEAGTDTLIKLYDSSKDPDVKRSVLQYLGDREGAKAAEKLRSIAQSDPDPEMRRDAVSSLAARAKSFEEIVSLFENARDPEMRRTVLDYLAQSSDPRVLDKLLAIAQSDADPDIRRSAVDYIAER